MAYQLYLNKASLKINLFIMVRTKQRLFKKKYVSMCIWYCSFILTLVKRLSMIMVIYCQVSNKPGSKGTSLINVTFFFKWNDSTSKRKSCWNPPHSSKGPILMPSSSWKPSWAIKESFLQWTSKVLSLTIPALCTSCSCCSNFVGFLSLPLDHQHLKALMLIHSCVSSPTQSCDQ